VSTPAAPPLPEELDRLLRRMRLPYLRKAAPDVLATARAQRWDPAEVLRVLLSEEVVGRDAATRRMRRKQAAFPTGKTLASWRPEESSIPRPPRPRCRRWSGSAAPRTSPSPAPPAPASPTSSRPSRTPPSSRICGWPGSPWSR
jgi:hypothetical protein